MPEYARILKKRFKGVVLLLVLVPVSHLWCEQMFGNCVATFQGKSMQSLCIMTICNFGCHFCFEGGTFVLIAPITDYCVS